MARMIPASFAATTSSGEKAVFRILRDDPTIANWIVLHSLDIVHHANRISAEIDFVIIIPCKGVVCVEVKGTRKIRRDKGYWYYGDDPKPDPRGPFRQASTAMHEIRRMVASKEPSFSSIPFWSAVILPYVEFGIMSGEWHSWQLIDSKGLKSGSLSKMLEHIMNEARMLLKSRSSTKWFYESAEEPDFEQCRKLTEIMRPTFEIFENPQSRLNRINLEIKSYTHEQFEALDALSENLRVAFSGPAGTGKTLLAIETARRSNDAGRNVLFLCFNRLLGKWLEHELEGFDKVTMRTLHAHMLRLSGIEAKESPNFWQVELPQRATEKLVHNEKNRFDEIIIDEGQDILSDGYLNFLNLSLNGGLSSGRWRLFGDFEKQAIYGNANLPLSRFVSERCAGTPIYSIRINCRNTPRIAELVHLVGGLNPSYRKVLRPDDCIEPQLLFYESEEEQSEIVLRILQPIFSEGYKQCDIVILSPKAASNCISSAKILKALTAPLEMRDSKYIPFCSIHSFKGLESPIVIVTDIEKIQDQSLLYVAMTRATHRLFLIMHKNVKKDLRRILGMPEI